MFVSAVASHVSKTKRTKQRTIVDEATRELHVRRNLAELEKEPSMELRFDVAKELLSHRSFPITIRRILTSKKTFVNYVDETPDNKYQNCVSRPSKRAPRRFCGVCGYWGVYACQNCGIGYCSKDCETVHLDTRCMKVYA
ncbi:Swr1 complex subunit Vps71 [Schizosaccharomyces japonicus yFS275]|uniref:Swr1 complex subunit Vps71 n=1 Tax=Schizosaccharomyces japonicus (strain yFS275 / FY16936) TaxID=402676 RepID=B6JVX2_SCHJY|nr:Swr1 complex subunit Vps71 [Schizosaccharomyces japonicus yFS275]EEB05523.1 Swr1 complex subunit Vps71 [Schizosaccharomyces japonicus yFS275]